MAIDIYIQAGLYHWFHNWRSSFGCDVEIPPPIQKTLISSTPEDLAKSIENHCDADSPLDESDMDDVHTEDLPLLLRDFLIGLARGNASISEPGRRIKQLESAQKHLQVFHGNLRKLFHPREDPLLVSIEQEAQKYCDRNNRGSAIRRRAELKRLEQLIVVPPELFRSESLPHHDEEIRDFWLAVLSLALFESCILFNSHSEEIRVIQCRLQEPESSTTAAPPGPRIGVVHIPDAASLRKQMQSSVFRPPHNLPTMTLDEIVAKEYHQDVEILQAAQKRSQAKYKRRSGENSDDYDTSDSDRGEVFEKSNAEQRAWDDWVDENPRGSGNKLINRG